MPGDDLLFHCLSNSTIGAVRFHGRVRDGIGWVTDAMVTKLWSRRGQGSHQSTTLMGTLGNMILADHVLQFGFEIDACTTMLSLKNRLDDQACQHCR